MGIFSCPCCVRPGGRRCVPGGSRCLLKLSQVGSLWQVGKCWAVSGLVSAALRQELDGLPSGIGGYSHRKITGAFPIGQRRYFRQRITHQFLTVHIENVIISVTTITKRLLVTRRAKIALYGVSPIGAIIPH